MFIEKPLSVKPPEEVADLSARLAQLQQDKGLIIAVGYMLRYSPAVEVRSGPHVSHACRPLQPGLYCRQSASHRVQTGDSRIQASLHQQSV